MTPRTRFVRRPRSARWRWLALALWTAGLGCLVSPPINQRPPELDVTFAFDPIDITPPNGDGIITLERVPPEILDFGVTEVRDPNLDDSLTYTFRFIVDGEEFAQQTLVAPIDRVRTEAEGETVYQPILQSFDPCLDDVDTATQVIIELTLSDEIPLDQRDVVDLRAAWETTVVWSVGFVEGQRCDDNLQ